MKRTVKKLLMDDNVSFDDFSEALYSGDVGDWDSVNSLDSMRDYICDMVQQGISVSHIMMVLEEDIFDSVSYYKMWLGNSMETPVPITTKEELVDALSLDGSEIVEI